METWPVSQHLTGCFLPSIVHPSSSHLGQACVQLELEHGRSLEQVVAGGGRHLSVTPGSQGTFEGQNSDRHPPNTQGGDENQLGTGSSALPGQPPGGFNFPILPPQSAATSAAWRRGRQGLHKAKVAGWAANNGSPCSRSILSFILRLQSAFASFILSLHHDVNDAGFNLPDKKARHYPNKDIKERQRIPRIEMQTRGCGTDSRQRDAHFSGNVIGHSFLSSQREEGQGFHPDVLWSRDKRQRYWMKGGQGPTAAGVLRDLLCRGNKPEMLIQTSLYKNSGQTVKILPK
uniref:Uncharacterized protein n=1 Tax=Branchiostoma floridae TaxID=7739 RepID=C3ZAT2_BRAFL|eukprot:XP_002593958.1 hypothetical protein BRAFLDRAFT_68605 [Branchiostoma floridae]